MKTSLDIPDELYRRVKSKSALEGRSVREVASALFTAWVDGRVELPSDSPPTLPDSPAANPSAAWLARWQELGERVRAATTSESSLSAQLQSDRR